MEEIDELDQLDQLLRADINEESNIKENGVGLREVNIFETSEACGEISENLNVPTTSAVHSGDTDSSDDEEKRNFTERKYNDYGSQIKKTLDNQEQEKINQRIDFETRLRQTNIDTKVARNASFCKKTFPSANENNKSTFCVPEIKSKSPSDVYTDPIFGIRITKPIISSSALLDRMQGREAVNMLRVKRYVENEDLAKDWVIAGVIVRKSSAKKSQKGNNFVIWTLSDLKDDLKTVSMFLFRKAYNELWKTPEGTVVAVLNPNVLDRSQNSTDQACLSVENSDRVMILGQSKDLGTCKSKKKNGEPCSAIVNLSQCEHCVYHVKQEYQKYSRRQELQSATMGKGLVNLQNKVYGKNTFIYGGKSYTALPKSDHKKIKDRDQNRLMSLSDFFKSEGDNLMMNKAPIGAGALKNNNGLLHSPTAQRLTDTQRLSNLCKANKNNDISTSQSLAEKVANSPTLGKGFGLKGSGLVDLNMSYSQRNAEKSKLNAIKLVQQKGGIEKHDPNNIKGTETGKKRALEKLNDLGKDENDSKRTKLNEEEGKKLKPIMSERFKKILEATSMHENLIKQHEDDEQEKYFNKLEKKEAMEEKMLNTFKLACKAVRCAKCKYTAFSAAQICKDERHPLKVLDTFKRFFKCADCNNRTVSLEILPIRSCSNCNGSRWEKAPMMREKKVTLSAGLSIRGEEEVFIGGQVTGGKNIDLLVPDS
ncbi:protein MCM10 homolog [Bicyclus anynana]|uniref:Protein MCM10 homolog n=1 Tax=Bicyclus anynana TaxID=110368 RepID=A0ABM3LVV0_BICAN|nr:protein MCM10 homolog [Bicyclus anynana]